MCHDFTLIIPILDDCIVNKTSEVPERTRPCGRWTVPKGISMIVGGGREVAQCREAADGGMAAFRELTSKAPLRRGSSGLKLE